MDHIHKNILRLLQLIETLIAIILSIAILSYCLQMIPTFWKNIINHELNAGLESIISSVFSLVIGVEFIKMICKPTTDTVVEVLIFTISRSLIVGHPTGLGNFFGVISIVILFTTQKYIFNNSHKEKELILQSTIQRENDT